MPNYEILTDLITSLWPERSAELAIDKNMMPPTAPKGGLLYC